MASNVMYAYYAVRSNSAVHTHTHTHTHTLFLNLECVLMRASVCRKLLEEAKMWNYASYVEDTFHTLPIELCIAHSKHWTHWLL